MQKDMLEKQVKDKLQADFPNYMELLSLDQIKELIDKCREVISWNQVWHNTISKAINSRSNIDFTTDIDKAANKLDTARNSYNSLLTEYKQQLQVENINTINVSKGI